MFCGSHVALLVIQYSCVVVQYLYLTSLGKVGLLDRSGSCGGQHRNHVIGADLGPLDVFFVFWYFRFFIYLCVAETTYLLVCLPTEHLVKLNQLPASSNFRHRTCMCTGELVISHHSSKYLLSCRWPLSTNFFDEAGNFHFEEKKNKRSVIEFVTLENEYLYVEKICDVVCSGVSGLPQRLHGHQVRHCALQKSCFLFVEWSDQVPHKSLVPSREDRRLQEEK